jgi:Fe-S cluster assembly scaffold protein SufB
MADYSKEFEAIAKAYEASGGNPQDLFSKETASLVVSHHKILFQNSIPGVNIEGEEIPDGVKAKIVVEPGTVVKDPVHLCFGVIPSEGIQQIVSEFEIGEGAKIDFIAHCSFPNAIKLKHVMDSKIHVGKNAEMNYAETHYHGKDGGIEVLPVTKAVLDEGGKLRSEFKLIKGAVGELKLDYEGTLGKDSVCEFDTKVYGKADDRILVKESLFLNGENSRGLAKSRIVATDRCVAEVIGEAVGNAPNSRGHVDCVEIIKGKSARVSAVPKLLVVDDRAKLTHEAAIGSVDKKQVETLMARGLDEDEAVDVVVKGMLR